ncbi:MAG: putative DNA binding domain-containing protein [Planctomycetes bacterium]|nr:putative DNA binding domain-containing protein [Planctomycetota bacterium]MCC7399295.1 putative DNA binding domain-containing protein [Planctomycetota bacterium]
MSDAATLQQLSQWLEALEGERFEFKEAKNRYDFTEVTQYLCALANEGGGRMLFGVTDQRPRMVVGTAAFPQIERFRAGLLDKLPVRIQVDEVRHPHGLVVVVTIAGRPAGTPLQIDGRYWCRNGDTLTTMTPQRLREIFAETGHDFSSDVCAGASLGDLDPAAVEEFRRRWMEKSGNSALANLAAPQLLRDAELLEADRPTFAALILLGTRAALGKHLPQAEVIFEYRSSEAAGPAQQRKEHRQGFFSFYEDLWQTINLRNDLQHYQEGLFVFDVPTFDERSVREGILNAICHRDYQLRGSVFLRQYSRRLVIESPGGWPYGVTDENLLDQQAPRNRRIAEALARCGLVERAGQGMNLMFERSIRQGKPRPEFTGTDSWRVVLTLHGELRDPRLLRFLERVAKETDFVLGAHDLLLLDAIHADAGIPDAHRGELLRLKELGIIESIGRGKGTRYLLARRFYAAIGEHGVYTRRRGLDAAANRQLLLQHLQAAGDAGSKMQELQQVLPAISRHQIKALLQALLGDGQVRLEGVRRASRWFAQKSHP